VFADRYHARLLKTPTDVRNVIHYLRNSHRHHLADAARYLPGSYVDPYASESAPELARPTLWAVKFGWRLRG
jgi:hypothetical protein